MTSNLRPDERASLASIEKSQNLDRTLKGVAKTAVGLGTAALGGGITARILPFLNEYVPSDLAVKGISKISPKIGNFLQKGMSMGLDMKDGLNFIKENIAKQGEKVPEERNIIQKYSDKLHEFIDTNIKRGLTPAQVVSLAEIFPHHKKAIDQIVKEHKTPFLNIVESIYGSPQQETSQQAQMQQPMKPQAQAQQNQPGQGQQALMAILQKIQQQRGG